MIVKRILVQREFARSKVSKYKKAEADRVFMRLKINRVFNRARPCQ
jgi:hypothetical protein